MLLFRKNFGVGLSCFGPLPCIEVIKTNLSLRELPENQYPSKTSKEFRACCSFFESLGYPFNLHQVYKDNDWWRFYEVHRSELFYQRSHSYQILVSLMDYEKSKYAAIKDYELSASGVICDTLHNLLLLLALEHFYEVLEDIIVDLKTELEPLLSGQIQGKITLRRLKSAISKMLRLNGFYFQHSRIWAGVDERSFLNYMCWETVTISRDKYHKTDSGLLRDDMKYRVDRSKEFCEEQLSLLRLSYEQILSYKTTTLNYGLQRATFWLSIAVAFLTLVPVLREEIVRDFIANAWAWLRNR
ncbi:MAG: hypothetical protein HC866_14110 [Leptolyngbyaceae cyanobacterium RU_5_1]|nr:hypothetical protein [Leptolyngbyaceae cyanobacterium RU_5_1]